MTSLGSFTPTYDNNGNLLNDNVHSYAWDANGRPTTLDGVTLTFDALDRLVEAKWTNGSIVQHVYSPTGAKLGYMNGQSLVLAFIPLPGTAKAIYYSGSNVHHYDHNDWLGSTRLSVSASQTFIASLAYAPFGDSYAVSSNLADGSFTGQFNGTVHGIYDFMYREYPWQGRFSSPDPAGLAAVDPANPQSWNRYSYVTNNPLNLIDPSGLNECAPGEHDCNWGLDEGNPGQGILGGGLGNPIGTCGLDEGFQGGLCVGGVLISVGFGGGGGNPAQNSGGTTAPTPPPKNPGTTLPGTPLGQIICVILPDGTQVCANAPYSHPSLFWSVVRAFWERLPWAGAAFIPIKPAGGMVSVMIPWAILPAEKMGCLGIGLAATTPTDKVFGGGPILWGNVNNAKNILSSFGYSFGGQANPLLGIQATSNSSGSIGGPTLATAPGLSAGFSWSYCGSIQ